MSTFYSLQDEIKGTYVSDGMKEEESKPECKVLCAGRDPGNQMPAVSMYEQSRQQKQHSKKYKYYSHTHQPYPRPSTHTHKHVYTVYWPLFVTCYIFSWEPVRGFKLAALAASVRPASVHSTLSIPCQLVALRHFLCNTQETSCTPNLPSIPPAAAHLPTQSHQEMAAIPPTRTRTWPITTHLLTKACLASPSFVWQPREDSLAASLSVFLAADTCGQWKY